MTNEDRLFWAFALALFLMTGLGIALNAIILD
jgi:hypothetical protein